MKILDRRHQLGKSAFFLVALWSRESLAWLTRSSRHNARRPITASSDISLHHMIPLDDSSPDDDAPSSLERRKALLVSFGMGSFLTTTVSQPAQAQDTAIFTRRTDKFAYEFRPPDNNFEAGNKPLKTHLDEVNFKSSSQPGYQFGITVDPVRINSLSEFGTPAEVAAKVVLAEVNRDGVFDVTLMEDPTSGDNFYQLNYLSVGKRGKKRYLAKFYVTGNKLFALTAQCLEQDYDKTEKELLEAVRSFRVLE